jgi:hypothetical protein
MEVALPVCVAARIAALLDGLTLAQLELLPPVERHRFAELCRHWHELADRPATSPAPEAGVLSDLRNGQRPE